MSRFIKIIKTIRNNWKKSLFGAGALSYGISYGLEQYQTNLLMKKYCLDAVQFGNVSLPPTQKPRHITVILNPTAKRRKAKKLFEKYCEPLLHLAGIAVTIIQTEEEAHARQLIENLNTPTDGILVAGGDGTLLDVVTGLMRKYQNQLSYAKQCPIGILPLGDVNKMADILFLNSYKDLQHIHEMADATMAVIRGATKPLDVVKVEPLEEDPENPIKPIYAVGSVEWGAWRDVEARKNKYWYWGNFRRYAAYVFNGFKREINWNCNAIIKYSDPCYGCSKCYQKDLSTDETLSGKRWWSVFIPRKTNQLSGPDYSQIKNDKCDQYYELEINTTELSLSLRNILNSNNEGPPAMKLQSGPEKVGYFEFVNEGWRRIKGTKTLISKTWDAKDIEFTLKETDDKTDKQQYFSIDNEEFELKSVRIKLIPNAIKIFCF